MKYSQRWFEFPIRVYDRYTAEKAYENEKKELTSGPQEGEWVAGKLKIGHKEIALWADYFDSTEGVEKVLDEGFTSTIVWTKSDGIFICPLPKKRFEQLLDEYTDKLDAYMDEQEKALNNIIEPSGGKAFIIK